MLSRILEHRFPRIERRASSVVTNLFYSKRSTEFVKTVAVIAGTLGFWSGIFIFHQHVSEYEKIGGSVAIGVLSACLAFICTGLFLERAKDSFEKLCASEPLAEREALALEIAHNIGSLEPHSFLPEETLNRVVETKSEELISSLIESINRLKAGFKENSLNLVSSDPAQVANGFCFLYGKRGYQRRLSKVEKEAREVPLLLEQKMEREKSVELSGRARQRVESAFPLQ